VAHGEQGGLGDIAVHPHFADNGRVYLSYAETGPGDTRGAAVARARLVLDDKGGGRLDGLDVIWRQMPKTRGHGHYGHRLLFGPDGKLWISSSERQKFDPAQDMAGNLGKIVRLNDDGSVPADNPFAARGGVAAQVWSLGHRNVLGMDFDAQAVCGKWKWARAAATNWIWSSAAPTTAGHSFPKGAITAAGRSPAMPPARSSPHRKSPGRR
jgi:glucose/arabinose dehydrogenase